MTLTPHLSEEDKERVKDKDLDILLHPNSLNSEQDIKCPKIIWQGLGHGSGIGEWDCFLKTAKYGDLLYGDGQENTGIFTL